LYKLAAEELQRHSRNTAHPLDCSAKNQTARKKTATEMFFSLNIEKFPVLSIGN
jgi:hypothetical protein